MSTLSFHKSAEWKTGLRRYLGYRDLGSVEASKGKILAHVVRAKKPRSGPGGYHTHDLEFQMNYMLCGWIRIEFEDLGEIRFEAGHSWHQVPNVKHEVLEYSEDREVIEICMPAEFSTEAAQR